ncbi:MAG: DUF3887 domain-containing protein [Candidatus Aenigmatarchaeota archaeon]|nr:MAG: DUF3887 domain-containing protein [Candidatus Aenigmarchaeota archaeon]
MDKSMATLAAVLLSVILVSGCTLQPADKELKGEERASVLGYASPIAEGILMGFNTGDYVQFSDAFSEQMLQSITEEKLQDMRMDMIPLIGEFRSLGKSTEAYWYTDSTGEYVKVIYSAEFEKEDPVMVSIVFLRDDPDHVVQGLFFSSPKLRNM